MQPTTIYEAGTVVTVMMRFADQTGAKPRPAVIISSVSYHRSRADTVITAVTGQVAGRNRTGDCVISDWQPAGLVTPSKTKGVGATIVRSAINREIGRLSRSDYERVQDGVRAIFSL